MRVRVDPSKCDAFGVCAEHLAEVFTLDEWGYASTEDDGEVPAGKDDLARKAIKDCPTQAISEG